MPEYGGTHLEAPIHFGEGRQAAHGIPLGSLVARAVVIDVSSMASTDGEYLLMPDDVAAFERLHGTIAPGIIVLPRTGWSARWPDRLAYLGDDRPGDASNLPFPSFGAEAARLLVESLVAALGADVASIDGGKSADFRPAGRAFRRQGWIPDVCLPGRDGVALPEGETPVTRPSARERIP